MKLYTTHTDYFATGEGRTVFIHITYAENQEDAKNKMKEKIGGKYGEYFILGAESVEGVSEDHETLKSFVPLHRIQQMRDNEGKAQIDFYMEHHLNFA